MKTKNIYFTAFMVLLSFACSDDDNGTPMPSETVHLEFTLETAQDQMGDFSDNAMAEYDGEIFSIGGINDYSYPALNSDVWKSDNGKNWISVSSDIFAARKGHTLTDFNGNIWLIGGYDAGPLEDIWYSPNGMDWTELPASSIPFRTGLGYHSTFIFDSKLYVYARDQGIWSTLDGITWELVNATPFPVRSRQQIVVLNGAIYVIGGSISDLGRTNEILKSTDGINFSLITITGTVFSPRDYFTATVYNNKIWILSGEDATDSPPNIWYSSNGSTWNQYSEPIPLNARLGHCTLNYEGALWVFGGISFSTGAPLGDIWRIEEL